MRLALALGRTVAELRATMDAEEWSRWLLFHSLYDLPDSFLVAGQLGSLVSHAVGGKGKPADFAPYYRIDSPAARKPTNNLRPFYNFLSAYAKEREAEGNPIPQERQR